MKPWSIHKEDCVEFLKSMSSESVDLVITDPAYESLEKHRAIGTTTRLDNWFEIFPNSRFQELLPEIYRVLKKNTHFYMFCDQETMFVVKPIAEACGFKFWKPIIWDKVSLGMGYHYRARYECILFFEKGKRKLNNLGIPDILTFKRVRGGYPTEKPVGLTKVLIDQSSRPGELVVNPFMGSASVGVAALDLGREYAGCDISDRSIDLASDRLQDRYECLELQRQLGCR
jgi:site-specific DNA-methyltransferase (adenine-specific)